MALVQVYVQQLVQVNVKIIVRVVAKKGVVTIAKKVAKEGVEDTVLVDAELIAAALVCSHVQIVVRGCVKQVVR